MKESTVMSSNPTPEQTSPVVAAPASGHDNGRINILLVDDEPRNLTVLETILDDPGYRLVRAESGEQALLSLISAEFAVILLDIQMPGMSGFEVAQMIKQRPKTASIPIIYLTAHYNEDRHVLEGYQTGAVDYLLKPINATIVRSKVAVFAELYRRTRESTAANVALLTEVAERRRVEEELRKLQNDLERRVAERTAELLAANDALQQIQSELRASDTRKDHFLAMLGHELRNPLAAIRYAIAILHQSRPESPELSWCGEVIERQSDHLTKLVNDLLDVSRVSRGQIQLEKTTFDLAVAVQEAVETCQPLIDARRHELTVTPSPKPLFVEGDRTRLTQVFANLINNAAKYTDEGGRISITLSGEEGAAKRAVVRVRDNGRGLDADAIGKLFDLFYQANVNLDRSDGGLGVGLALVRSLVEMHGGMVEARSAGLGKGSEFIARLPIAGDPAPRRANKTPAVLESSSVPLRILVVDDNVDAARSLAMMLKILGHQVLLSHDGPEALATALREKPDVILLDIGLPGMNGYEVCRSLRQQGMTAQLIVAITGYSQDKDRQVAAEAGFDKYLVKPVTLPDIERLLPQRAAKSVESKVNNANHGFSGIRRASASSDTGSRRGYWPCR